jgi:hypothetical protein
MRLVKGEIGRQVCSKGTTVGTTSNAHSTVDRETTHANVLISPRVRGLLPNSCAIAMIPEERVCGSGTKMRDGIRTRAKRRQGAIMKTAWNIYRHEYI